ncbi:hypothetical protein [Breoghania sp.]|uniref:hypothetical protein n=1 Tax=Breoghania sp. TaxID=2065378 RepID=UPI0029C9FE57|nr:hypothetical protein [Breoghania sp.]
MEEFPADRFTLRSRLADQTPFFFMFKPRSLPHPSSNTSEVVSEGWRTSALLAIEIRTGLTGRERRQPRQSFQTRRDRPANVGDSRREVT